MEKWIAGALAAAVLATGAAAAERPNVVIIYGDDVGYADVGVYGAKLIPTPNLDRLAGEGLVFTDAHCSASTCTPSRFSLLTGRMGFRNGARILPPGAPLIIPTDILTLPKLFKQAGYTTGVVGKWHLGLGRRGTPVDWNGEVKPGPLEVGFDHSFLLPSTNDRVPCVYLENYRVVDLDPRDPLYLGRQPNLKEGSTVYPDGRKNREAMTYYQSSHGHNNSVINGIGRIGYMAGGESALWDDETMADEFVKQAGKFIAANADKPFFLYFASQDVHVPRTPHPRFRGKSKLTYRGDAMVQLDWSVGAVVEILDKHGLKENTIVIFSSDNGPVYDDGYKDGTTVKPKRGEVDRGHDASGPYRGGKYEISEGGTRVPLIVRWPERIRPGKSAALVTQVDFVASFAKLLEVELPEGAGIDSQDCLAALLGEDAKGDTYIVEESGGTIALRKGDWKVVTGAKTRKGKKGPQLYDLSTDVAEKKNLAGERPDLARTLADTLARIRRGKGLRHEKLEK
jgi:arylsulfatase A-like enzyme